MKLLLVFVLILCTSVTKEQNFRPFAEISAGINNKAEVGSSVEVGGWGVKSPFSYSLDFDANYGTKFKDITSWIGPKLYYQFVSIGNFGSMIYMAPKFALKHNDAGYVLFEQGLCLNYNLTSNRVISLSPFFQSAGNYRFEPNISLQLVFLR